MKTIEELDQTKIVNDVLDKLEKDVDYFVSKDKKLISFTQDGYEKHMTNFTVALLKEVYL